MLADLFSTGALANPDVRVLEVGCGTANYLRAIAHSGGCHCWGLDPSAGMLAQASTAGARRLHLLQARAERLPFTEGSFELIFSVDVIHHVSDPAAYFAEARRTLTVDGALCTVTDSESIIRRREPLSRYFPDTIPAELARYPRIERLESLLRAAGFCRVWQHESALPYTVTDLQPFAERAYSALHLIPDAAWARGLACMREDLQQGPIPAVARYTHLWATG